MNNAQQVTDYLPVYLSDKDLAERFSVSRQSIWRWTRQGVLPQPHKISPGCSRWRADEVAAYLEGVAND